MTGAVGKKLSAAKRAPKQRCIPTKTKKKQRLRYPGAEIQTLAVDTRTAVWVSTAEKIVRIVLGETRNVSQMFGVVSAPALYKNPAVTN